ncbi:MAG TPA: hypothetical protein VN870_12475, partial [Streptosporangiaceae bacterium]|nr:hypothetical protein [Streptosporangiaceae bacterium]
MLAFEGEFDEVDSGELAWYVVVFVAVSGSGSGGQVLRAAGQLTRRMMYRPTGGRGLMLISGAVLVGPGAVHG